VIWKEKDKKKTLLSDTPEKRELYMKLEDDYSNESLRDFVTNSNELEKIVEYEGYLVQKNFPIYLSPVHKGFWDAQFYAPTKKLFGKQITTLSANLIVIWGMTLLLAIMLFFNGLKMIIDSISIALQWLAKTLSLRIKFPHD
jgi:hypothetical protein